MLMLTPTSTHIRFTTDFEILDLLLCDYTRAIPAEPVIAEPHNQPLGHQAKQTKDLLDLMHDVNARQRPTVYYSPEAQRYDTVVLRALLKDGIANLTSSRSVLYGTVQSFDSYKKEYILADKYRLENQLFSFHPESFRLDATGSIFTGNLKFFVTPEETAYRNTALVPIFKRGEWVIPILVVESILDPDPTDDCRLKATLNPVLLEAHANHEPILAGFDLVHNWGVAAPWYRTTED